MTAIKIISDPYRRIVEFRNYNQSTNEWVLVNNTNNPGSKLIKDNIRTNFFPYKVKEIIDIIAKEYGVENEKLQIVFEGSGDEFEEISSLCKSYEDIELIQSAVSLENARDILPQIVNVFNKVKPIVDNNISNEENRNEINNDIAKLLDAANDTVPICVLGNYSSGKSTFINALMGVEILPSGDMPVTAKIYKIKQSTDKDIAVIDFEYNTSNIDISILENEYHISCEEENDLVASIRECLESHAGSNLAEKVNACLDVINKTRDGVSDLINIQMPFARGPLGDSKKSIVIFDTPGSNAATHKDHFSILEGAMKNLSNGIPIYVAEYHTLDSCDNETLYENIKSISQIDSRFTMIVVNKADKANIEVDSFDKKMEENILRQAVPKNLYSGGIFFVSSIIGLGAKTDGKFTNKYIAREYSKNHIDYEDERSEWYQQLYEYNIMPEQIKANIVEASETIENKIFANSGLYALEHEITNFAEKYSAYDKCKQSDKYINNIIEATQSEINSKEKDRETKRANLQKELDEDKQLLMENVKEKGQALTEEFRIKYDNHMYSAYKKELVRYEEKDIKDEEGIIRQEKQSDVDYEAKRKNMKDSFGAILDDFADDLKKGNFGEMLKNVGDNIKVTKSEVQVFNQSRKVSNRETADELIRYYSDDFNLKGAAATSSIDLHSRSYWENNAEELKKALALIVANSPTLDEEKKKELSRIIINYANVSFGEEHVFEKANFEKKLKLFAGPAIDLNKINTKKLTESYNRDFKDGIDKIVSELKMGHLDSFKTWKDALVDEITKNIVSYSPKLSKQAQEIEKQKKIIKELKRTREILMDYSKQIQSLMDWSIKS